MMKLFLKYNGSYGDYGFEVLDETAYTKYTVSVRTEKNKQQIIIKNLNKQIIAEIFNKNIVFRYFSVKCMGRFYILFPVLKEYFAFMIYGSTYKFAGDISQGNFSLIDVDKSPVMTQKKCWGQCGDGFELNIYNEEQEIFSICCAICAAMYMTKSDTKTQMVGDV